MGFTQRQAGGKFTRDEADTFIAQLESEAEFDAAISDAVSDAPALPETRPVVPRPKKAASAPAVSRQRGADPDLSAVSDAHLAAELQRRGWIVMEP